MDDEDHHDEDDMMMMLDAPYLDNNIMMRMMMMMFDTQVFNNYNHDDVGSEGTWHCVQFQLYWHHV